MKAYNSTPMQHNYDWAVGLVSGAIGGMLRFMHVSFLEISYPEALLKAGFTALFCGFMGVLGKHCFSGLRKWYLSRKKKNK
jgi:hypothetical protein